MKTDRIGFIIKNKIGFYNAIVKDRSTQEWFLWDEDITEFEDLKVLMILSDIVVIEMDENLHIEDWMISSGSLDF